MITVHLFKIQLQLFYFNAFNKTDKLDPVMPAFQNLKDSKNL